jgi:CheY-like chemotaxis protein
VLTGQHMPTVLLIDDDPVEHHLLSAMILRAERTDIEISGAASLEEALQCVRQIEPRAVLLDHRLPPYDDYRKSMNVLRSTGYEGPVVVISAAVGEAVFDEASAHGVIEVIDKLKLWDEISDGLFERIMPIVH